MNKHLPLKSTAAAILLSAVLAAGPAPAKADPRSYVWTYEYMTVREGHAELEYYSTTEVADTDAPETSTWKHQVELEYGLTPRTDIAMYQNFKQANTPASKTFSYEGMKLRLRHRLAEKGELPVDTLLYAEYVRSTDLASQGAFEGKVVLAKNLGRLNLAYNQVAEFPLEKLSAAEHRFSAAAGWRFSDIFRAGLEATGDYKANAYHAGPTVHLRARDMKLWANLGYLAGLNSDSKDAQTRLIIGVPF
jgi:hypothetical protein